jgi:hypothetical protein
MFVERPARVVRVVRAAAARPEKAGRRPRGFDIAAFDWERLMELIRRLRRRRGARPVAATASIALAAFGLMPGPAEAATVAASASFAISSLAAGASVLLVSLVPLLLFSAGPPGAGRPLRRHGRVGPKR